MKNLVKFLVPAAVAALALVSCNKEDNYAAPADANAVTIRVHASADALKGDDQETKTYIDANKTILWGTGEYMKLALTAGETTTFATSTDASADIFDGDAEAMFEFSISPATASEYVYQGLYPASATVDNKNPDNYKVNLPAIQNATASSYDPAAYIMVAKPESFASVQTDWEASFRRGTALNKITLKNFASSVEINKVKITAEGKKLAGGRHFNLTTGEGLEVYGTDATIEVLYATPLTGTSMDVWFTSWDAELAEGEKLTIVAFTTDNKSYTKEITVPAGKTIKFQEQYLNTLGAKFDGITPENVASLDGDYVILAKHNTSYYALKGEASTTRIASVDYTGSTTSFEGDASLVWTIAASGTGYTIKNGGNFVGWNGGSGSAANNAALFAEADYDATKCLMVIEKDGDVYHIKVSADQSRVLAKNTGSAYFAFYASTGQYSDIVLVPATAMEKVETPTFSPAAGEVTSGTNVSISCATSGATIHYTVDGTDPTSSSATYSSPIEITATTTIKAIAVKSGMADSEVATAQYTIAGVTDYSVIETSNVTLTAGTNGSDASVNSEDAIKVGTSSKGGDMTVTVPAGTTKLHLHAAAWNGVTGLSLNISGATVSPTSIALTADSGIANNSPFTLTGNPADFYFVLELSDITADTEITFTSSIAKRFVVWGVNAEAGASVTWNLDSIAITTEPTKTTYTAGQSFDPAGMVVTGHFVDADNASNTKDEAVTGYTITPDGALAVTDDHVTITYQGKSATQAITVNAAPVVTYDFETVAELNALVTATSAEYSGYLTNAVVSFVPATNTAIVKDATGSVMIYKSGHALKQGQTYTGAINVTAIKYNSLYSEITVWDAAFTGAEAAVSPESVSLADLIGNYDDYQNAYVQVAGLTVSSVDGKNIHVTDGTNTYVVYDNPGTATCGAGDVITAVGTITKYSTTEELKIWDASAITITAVAPKAITFSQPSQAGCSISVSAGGSSITSGTTVASGTTVTISASAGTGYNFSSWTVNGATVADASAATTTFTMGTSAVSISASFSTIGGGTVKKYVKVTSGAIGGEYLIVRESSSYIYDGSLSNPDAANNYQTASDLSSLDYDTWKAYAVTIEAYESGYSIKTAAGKYIGRNANSNGIDSATSPTSPNYVNTISFASNGTVTILGNGGRKFNFNSSSGKFRYFASGNTTEIYLYQLQEVSE